MKLEFHPLANLFPLIEGAEFDDLVGDIRANGLHDPIDVYQSKVLDGRNRYRAAEAAGLEIEARHIRYFRPELYGDPLKYVLSKNLHRRHLNDVQRASIGGKIANLSRGRPGENPPIGGISTAEAATTLNVAPRQVERARVVHQQGIEEVRAALDRGQISVSAAEEIARRPAEEQVEIIRRTLPNGARAIMSSRQEPDDSLDYFPTPPWATRALMEVVLPAHGITMRGGVNEPACGEGHIAEVLREYPSLHVMPSDIFDGYGYATEIQDYLSDDVSGGCDWTVTNPPFGDAALAFVEKAIRGSRIGVAMFFRSQWAVEGIERYQRVFRHRPPTICAFFVERVNLCKGRWDPDGSTATAYCWLVWHHGAKPLPTFWIPPGQREALTRPDDAERFTNHPVIKRDALPPHDPETGEIKDEAA